MRTRLKKHLPRNITRFDGKKEETLVLTAKELRSIYYTTKYDMELGNLLKNALLAEKLDKRNRDNLKNIPF